MRVGEKGIIFSQQVFWLALFSQQAWRRQVSLQAQLLERQAFSQRLLERLFWHWQLAF